VMSMSVCLFVCLSVREHMLEITRPNFTKRSMRIASGGGSGIPWWHRNMLLPVLWMTSFFMFWTQWRRVDTASESLNESFVQREPWAKSAMHRCLLPC